MSVLPEPRAAEQALLEILRGDVHCRRDGDELVLDTPLILQDGHLFQVFLSPSDPSGLRVTDGGFAASQVEVFARSTATVRERHEELKRIARRLDLEWEGEFWYAAPDLEAAVQRVPILCQAVDRALSLTQARPSRRESVWRSKLEEGLRAAGLKVAQRAKIVTHTLAQPITVDYQLRRNGTEAAVEVLTSRTTSGAQIAVDRTITNFHLLTAAGYQGYLFAVYDEQSPAGQERIRARFRMAGPGQAFLVAGREAAQVIARRMGA